MYSIAVQDAAASCLPLLQVAWKLIVASSADLANLLDQSMTAAWDQGLPYIGGGGAGGGGGVAVAHWDATSLASFKAAPQWWSVQACTEAAGSALRLFSHYAMSSKGSALSSSSTTARQTQPLVYKKFEEAAEKLPRSLIDALERFLIRGQAKLSEAVTMTAAAAAAAAASTEVPRDHLPAILQFFQTVLLVRGFRIQAFKSCSVCKV